jgi:hypothetical protein
MHHPNHFSTSFSLLARTMKLARSGTSTGAFG